VDGEVGEHLRAEGLVAVRPQLRALVQGDDVDAARQRRRVRFTGDGAHLLDLAIHLDEAEGLGEGQGPLVVDPGQQFGQPESGAVLGQRSQERRPDAPSAMLRKDPGCGEPTAGRVGEVGSAGADHGAVHDGQQQQQTR